MDTVPFRNSGFNFIYHNFLKQQTILASGGVQCFLKRKASSALLLRHDMSRLMSTLNLQ